MNQPQPGVSDASNSPIVTAYRERTAGSEGMAREAQSVLPSGIVHDARRMWPHAIYVDRAQGSRKWDVDGNEFVDYYGGHGALILGHGEPRVIAAVQAQLQRGTHYAACSEAEVRWAEQVQTMVPGAERVRFTSSGTEANLMAARIARACTGREKLVRFQGHFHGWQDHAAFGVDNHFDGSATPGVLEGIAEGVLLADPSNLESVLDLLRSRDDIAVVMLEPTGGSFGLLPVDREFVAALREVTEERGILLHFDEVVTGFRVAPGGAQAHYGITPDLTTCAKILAGGLPGGCVAGRKDLLDRLDFDVAAANGVEKIGHQGTYNANPLSAAAGIACLDIVRSEGVCEKASATAAAIRDGVNRVFAHESVPWACYGEHSGFYFYLNPEGEALDPLAFHAPSMPLGALKASGKHPAATKLRLALMLNGVDMSGKPGGTVSAAHTEQDVSDTVNAVREAVHMLRAEGEI
jgi:glutamate-1-semialdehyde 2,1-aminomutase